MTDADAAMRVFVALQKRLRQRDDLAEGKATVIRHLQELEQMQTAGEQEILTLQKAMSNLAMGREYRADTDEWHPTDPDRLLNDLKALL